MIVHGKLGTMPAMIQLRYNYKLRPGLRVVYREVPLDYRDWRGHWQTGIVTKIEPVIFIDRF